MSIRIITDNYLDHGYIRADGEKLSYLTIKLTMIPPLGFLRILATCPDVDRVIWWPLLRIHKELRIHNRNMEHGLNMVIHPNLTAPSIRTQIDLTIRTCW